MDRNGQAINSTYDPAGRLTGQTWFSPAGVQVNSLTYGFDAAGNQTSAASAYGTYSFVFDPANRVTQQTDPFSLTLHFGYDHNGNVTGMTDSTGGTETSLYNADNELTSRRLTGGPGSAQLRIDMVYTPLGQVSSMSRYADPAGTQFLGKTQNTYDLAGNLTEEKHTNAANTVLEDFQYTLDAANRLGSETDTIAGTPTTTNYGYDATNQLTSAGGQAYSFDLNGNRTLTGYQTGAENQLVSDGAWTYKYDAQGNQVEKDGVSGGPNAGLTWKSTYDNAGRLVVAAEYNASQQLQVQVTNSYDVFGNQVEQDVYTASNNQTTVNKYAQQMAGLASGSLAEPLMDLGSSNQPVTRREFLAASDAVFARIGQTGAEDFV